MAAHPVDEVAQGAYITLAPGEVRIELDITPGPAVAGALLRSLDTNADRRVTDEEARAYAERVLKQSTLTLDGVAVSWTMKRVRVPPYANLEQQGDTLKIYGLAKRADRAGVHSLTYQNRYAPAQGWCIANVFLAPDAHRRYEVSAQEHSDDGRLLTVRYTMARL